MLSVGRLLNGECGDALNACNIYTNNNWILSVAVKISINILLNFEIYDWVTKYMFHLEIVAGQNR